MCHQGRVFLAGWQRGAQALCESPLIPQGSAVPGPHLPPCFSRQLVGAERLSAPCCPQGVGGQGQDFLVPGLRCAIPACWGAPGVCAQLWAFTVLCPCRVW